MFDLAIADGGVVAATNGGLVRFDGGHWKAVASPSSLRSIEGFRPLSFVLADGQRSPTTSKGLRQRSLREGIVLDPGAPWPKVGIGPPPGHSYTVLKFGATVFAGTSDGLYRGESGRWVRERLPSKLPLSRPNGIAQVGGDYVVGGLGGLFIGRPGAWKKVADDAIRQVRGVGSEVWVLHGNGALDKLQPEADRLFPDVLSGAAKRPWTSSIGRVGNLILLGGHGGWAERSATLKETYPPEIAGDVVTALAGRSQVRWIGTQKSGVLRFGGGQVRRWNPGTGLPDTWVTSLFPTLSGLIVGTANRGVFRIVGDKIAPLACPTRRVTTLGEWKGRLIVGGMDGAWIQSGPAWTLLPTGGEETTAFALLGSRLAITTASGVYFF
ncbi:hypothetical protein EON81_08680 [bacterium]|nr:MAG: hypothetical protein EON81_08680 [bacterium]